MVLLDIISCLPSAPSYPDPPYVFTLSPISPISPQFLSSPPALDRIFTKFKTLWEIIESHWDRDEINSSDSKEVEWRERGRKEVG